MADKPFFKFSDPDVADHSLDPSIFFHMGVSENRVPLNSMVFMIIIPMKNGYFIGNIPNSFRQTHMFPCSPDVCWLIQHHLSSKRGAIVATPLQVTEKVLALPQWVTSNRK